MSLKPILRRNNRGDTIVEVIVVLAVLGLAISIAYATANRSLLDARQAQEASQASELIQSQLESLITMAGNLSTDPNYIFPPSIPQPFCTVPVGATGSYSIMPASTCDTSIYKLNITYLPKPPAPVGGTFMIVASWDDVEGEGRDTATLVYNLYPTPKSP